MRTTYAHIVSQIALCPPTSQRLILTRRMKTTARRYCCVNSLERETAPLVLMGEMGTQKKKLGVKGKQRERVATTKNQV